MASTIMADRSVDGISFELYIGHTIRYMQFLRMWKTDVSLPRWKNFAISTMVAVLCTGNFLLMLSEIIDIRNSPDLRSGALNIGAIWLHFTGFFKWTYFILNSKRIVKLIGSLELCHVLCLKMNKRDEGHNKFREIMDKTRRQSVLFMNGWSVTCIFGIANWCINPLILYWHERNFSEKMTNVSQPIILPYNGWYMWDLTDSFGYACAYTFQCISTLGSVVGTVSYDVFYLTILMILCAQFRYVDFSLASHTQDELNGQLLERYEIDHFHLEEQLRNCAVHHQAVLDSLQMLEELTSPPMFVQCINTIGVICLVSFTASTNLSAEVPDIIQLWTLAIYFSGGCFQLFFFCYNASEITSLGLQVADSAYRSGWEVFLQKREETSIENHSRKLRRIRVLLQLFMIRAQKPIHMTGGPFYVLSLQTFISIMGLAFSYFTVLRHVNEE